MQSEFFASRAVLDRFLQQPAAFSTIVVKTRQFRVAEVHDFSNLLT